MSSTYSNNWQIVKKYRAIIIAVFIFFVCDMTVMLTNIYSSFQIADSAVSINLAGRQRMLSQRMTKVLLSLQYDAERQLPMKKDLEELGLVNYLFGTSLIGFRDGDTVKGGDLNDVFLVQVETEASKRFVENTFVLWEPYQNKLEPLLKNLIQNPEKPWIYTAIENIAITDAELEDAVSYARENNLQILANMNNLTTDLEHTANQRAYILRVIQIVGLLIAMFNVFYTLIKSLGDLVRGDRQLFQARRETSEILETVREGLFLIDTDWRIGTQLSASLPQVLRREVSPDSSFLDILRSMVDDQIYASARDYIELLFGNRVKETLVSDLNPLDRIEVFGADNTRHYLNFNFNRVFEGTEVSHLLVTVQDVTDVVHLSEELEASKDQARREIEVLLDLLGRDPASLGQFLSNTESALAQINERMRNNDDTMQGRSHTVSFIMRVVHGIKGESAALNIEMFEGYAHDFEQELSEMRDRGEIRGEDVVRISVLLEGFYDRLSTVSTVMKRFNGSDVPAQVVEEMPAEVFENHIKSLAARIAEDSGKNVSVNVDADALNMLPNRIFNELQGITIQLVRNALKHGVETPPLRQAAGKPETGRVAVSCRDLGNNLCELSVRDDGAGISVERIRQRLIDTGVMTATDARNLSAQEVIMHIFKTGFSTATEADRDAGRGVGLDIVSEKVVQLHGNLTLNSKVGEFTEFKITFEV